MSWGITNVRCTHAPHMRITMLLLGCGMPLTKHPCKAVKAIADGNVYCLSEYAVALVGISDDLHEVQLAMAEEKLLCTSWRSAATYRHLYTAMGVCGSMEPLYSLPP